MTLRVFLKGVVFCAPIVLAACAQEPPAQRAEPLGDFRLGHNIAIADNVQEGPFSRDLREAEIEASVQQAVARRLGRFDGDGLYHLGVYVGAVVLAQPGIPIIYTPRSNMVFEVNVFDNATRQRLNEEPKRIIVSEGLHNSVPLLGSGLTRGPDEQLANLSENAARQIEDWLRENEDWFAPKPGQVRVPFGPGERAEQGPGLRAAAERALEQRQAAEGADPPG